ncbi:hypothetical protein OEZ85_005828 [Tetradesmus obliquus]|uniref:Uncharacterized protein n=1 Tax=Tetradesmus obliquus TaxID=3088 RepID=A0ABY8UEQ3_TETOB|nr:hypothetical protein OEZ85_005828 [Tetradesmus obliquus]
MAYQAEDRDLLEEKVKAVYLQLRLVGDASPAQQRHAQEELRKVLSNIKAIGEPRLIKQQRRGAIWEHNAVYPQLHKLVPGITKDDISPAHDSNQASAKRSLELWREAECLALRPHSMARLKALPELRQIIAHAAVPAIHSCAGELRQLAAAAQTQRDAEADAEALWEVEKARRQPGGEAQLSRAVLQRAAAAEARLAKAAEAAAAGAAAAGDEDELFSADVRQMLRKEWLDDDSDKELLAHVAPGLRLCLAAEVAVGMLCVG